MVHQKWFILPPIMEYYYQVKNMDYKRLPPFKAGCNDVGTYRMMDMIYPKNNAAVYIPLELDGRRGKIILNAAHRRPNAKIHWHIDNSYQTTTTTFHQLAINPAPGKHVLTLVDNEGERLVQVFTVIN